MKFHPATQPEKTRRRRNAKGKDAKNFDRNNKIKAWMEES